MPFEVPESWCWTTLGEIGNWQAGATPSRMRKDYYGGNIPWLKTGDLTDGYIYEIPETITDKALEETSVKLNPTDSVLIAMYGATIGKIGILTFPATTNQACCACVDYKAVTPKYLFNFLLSHKEEFVKMGGGGAQPNISKEKIISTLIPIPPIAEQNRIADEIERLITYIEAIELNQGRLEQSLKLCKERILDMALSGKLIPQDQDDEPAIELLRKINSSFSPADNRHYENVRYPDSWEVVKMGEMVRIISGVAYSKSDVTVSGIKVIRGGNIQAGEIIECDDDVYIDNRYADPTNNIYKGDIVLVASTGSQQLIGKTGFATRDYVQTQIGAFLRILRPKDIRCADFLNLFFQSDYYRQYIRSLAKGTNINNVKNSYIEDFVIGLPPLQEQNRIVAITNKIFYMIDEILAGL